MQSVESELWLQSLPLDEPVDIDGERVFLRVEPSGAELGVHFMERVTDEQLQTAMRLGFQNAVEFDAGWSISTDGATLLLTQWLPNASGWTEITEALEQLLNQVELLRSLDAINTVKSQNTRADDEQRIRSKLMRQG